VIVAFILQQNCNDGNEELPLNFESHENHVTSNKHCNYTK